jgi:hypothetical protein
MIVWSLFVDIEGFSTIYNEDPDRALLLMRDLANGIHAIGSRVFSDISSRFLAFGLGDGFLIVPDLEQPQSERPVAISVALMHYMLSRGGLLKASISHGEITDIFCCFSRPVQKGLMGAGHITIFPIMGTALSNAYKLGSKVKGASVLLDSSMIMNLPKDVQHLGSDPVHIDWINSRWPLLDELVNKSGFILLSPLDVKHRLHKYIEREGKHLKQNWIKTTLEFIDSNSR